MSQTLHPNTAKIQLDYPVEISGVEVKHLVMRRPKVRDLMAANKGGGSDADMALMLVANLCSITPDEVLELDAADWQKCEEQVAAFKQAKS